VKSLKMHDRHNVTSCRVTDPAGNSPKSNTSFDAFAFVAFVAWAFAFLVALVFDGAAFFDFDAGAAFAFFAAVFDLLLVAAIVADSEFTWMGRIE
jgi:hypothetical protein